MPDGDDGRGADDWDGDIPDDYPSGAPDGECSACYACYAAVPGPAWCSTTHWQSVVIAALALAETLCSS